MAVACHECALTRTEDCTSGLLTQVQCADSDVLVCRELRNLINDAKRRAKVAPRSADEGMKWLEWGQYLHVVQELRHDPGSVRRGSSSDPPAGAKCCRRWLKPGSTA